MFVGKVIKCFIYYLNPMSFNYKCPYCNQSTTITDPNHHEWSIWIHVGSPTNRWKIWDMIFSSEAIVCPNKDCGKINLKCSLKSRTLSPSNKYSYRDLDSWQLLPVSEAKVLPDYIPDPIKQDYYEACRIRDLSPKASATLSRRCLQWMIRDFRKITKPKLSQEINELKWKISDKMRKAIDGVRSIWNIWAHMEEDINYIIDVDPNEAQSLIWLIEFLVENWYIKRHEEDLGIDTIIKIAQQKKDEKNDKSA